MKFATYILLFLSLTLWGQNQSKNQTIDDYFYNAMNERLKENYEKSNEWFEKCLLIDTKNDAIFFKMAQNYFDLKQYEQSLTYLNKAIKNNPNNKWYQKLYIEIQIKQQADTKAITKLIKDFEPVADNPYIIRDLYRQLYKSKQRKVKKQPVKKHVESGGTLARLWQQKKYEDLTKEAEKILDTSPDNIEAYLYMAKALTAFKKYQEALDYLDMGMDFVQDNLKFKKQFYQQYITIYTKMNQPAKANLYRQKLKNIE